MAKGAAVAAAAAARERKGATAVGREGKGTAAARERKSTAATAAAVGRDGGGAAAVVAAVGGAAAAASSRHGSGPAVAPVGGLYFTGAASDGCPSFNSQATDGSPQFAGVAPSTNGTRGCGSTPPSLGAFPFDFSNWSTWDMDPRPPGGFMSFFHNQPQQSQYQNFHFPGAPSHSASPSLVETITPQSTEKQPDKETVNVDSGDDAVRTEKRILWTQDEDVKLMSAWLNNSLDPISGTDKRNEQYWGDVADSYNKTVSGHRRRNPKQVKDRWHKINKWTDLFHSAWLKAKRIFTSGHSDQMWIDKAHKFYEDDNKDLKLGHFVLMDVWYAVRAEAKWVTYNNELKKARKRKDSDKVEGSEATEPIDLDERPCPRPIGQKAAKRAAYEGNLAKSGKRATEPIDVDELDRYGKIQSEAHANRLKVLEIQQKLSAERMESSKIAHLAAKEQKEARKLELEARMMESYNILQAQDVSRMSDEEKADHAHTLKCLKKRLFPETI